MKDKKGFLSKSLLFLVILMILSGCATVQSTFEKGKNKIAGWAEPKSEKGTFRVIGIGPGDPELMTVRALEAIKKADLVFCGKQVQEKLCPYVNFEKKDVKHGYQRLFRFYGKDCSQVVDFKKFRGKLSCEDYHVLQDEFIRLVREETDKGRHVVILSNGDPAIYGVDIWSVRALSDLNPSVIPGLSIFNAANAALKVNLGDIVITAPMERENKRDTLEALSENGLATIVIFMPRNMSALFLRLSASYPPETPVAIVSDAGVAGKEKVTRGTVESISDDPSGVSAHRSIVYVGNKLTKKPVNTKAWTPEKSGGSFYLVGMGPGDPDLITLRAMKVIEKADIIFAHKRICEKFKDALAGKEVINGYHRLFPFYGTPCESVAEEENADEKMSCDAYHQKQAEFSKMVRDAVSKGKTVAMLDSGDPMVYGPCAWSLLELADLPTEVVPGLSCFNAANAALRTGVTESETAHAVILASGKSVKKMAAHQSTMVLFTMRTDFEQFVDALSENYPPETPVAIVKRAGYTADEKVIHSTLRKIPGVAKRENLPFEYLLYVGDFLEKSVGRKVRVYSGESDFLTNAK